MTNEFAARPVWNEQRPGPMPAHRYRSYAEEVEPVLLADPEDFKSSEPLSS